MRMDGDQRIKISGWKKRQPSVLEVNLNDPASFRPLAMGTHAGLLWPYAIMTGWMTKHMPPAFSFTKTRHRRYVLLLDRILYTFKNDNPKNDFREFFELTQNTNIFVTDQFPAVLFCLEIQRTEDGRTWYLQAEGADDMKVWMDKLKRAVQWLKYEEPGVLTRDKLDTVVLEVHEEKPTPMRPSISSDSFPSSDKKRFSTYSYHYTAPPQPPPPQGPPPPIPSSYYYSEHQISAEHLVASQQLASPTSTSRRPSRLPDVLPPQLPPPTSTLPPPPPMR
ncbi:hypothetical protein BJV82DRAFT_635767 [Fennellomyces sp. T-0311]|nr:hypothetical protein BJV82DRAFT_635767 [Fennellomyces sp. T-0311]